MWNELGFKKAAQEGANGVQELVLPKQKMNTHIAWSTGALILTNTTERWLQNNVS